MGFNHAWVLILLPLCLMPLWLRKASVSNFVVLNTLPADRLSSITDYLLALLRSLAIAALIFGLSGPWLPSKEIERIGEGAQIVLLLDRSRSMDQAFGGQEFKIPLMTEGAKSKGQIARALLSQFVSGRRHDKYGMLVFSTQPIQVIPLTDKTEVVAAAIEAGNIGRGLSETNVGTGLIEAVRFFEDQPYTGSRIVTLISDGGARLDLATRAYINELLLQHRVALYWIYIRSYNSPGLVVPEDGVAREDTAPARVLHEFFQSLSTPYRAFDAEDPDALAAAITEIDRLQSLPIRYVDIIPRQIVSRYFYLLSFVAVTLLLLAKLIEVRQWSAAPYAEYS